MDEFALIDRLFAPLARGAAGAFDLRDDAAVFEIAEGHRLIVTTDLLVAGVHFLADDEPALVARKLLRVNLSDLAAMGAAPRAYLLGLAIPRATTEDWLEAFAGGLADDQAAYDVQLIGGDTVATEGPLVASLTALGEVRAGVELRRAGARPGDAIFVSGTLGDAALGLLALRGGLAGVDEAGRAELIERYRLPRPRVALGQRLVGLAHAAADVSDGLVADLGHICECSGVAAEVEAARLPLSPAVRAALASDPALLNTVLAGGDDYELVFTAAPDAATALSELAAEIDVAIAAIGRIIAGSGVRVLDEHGAALDLPESGYRHM